MSGNLHKDTVAAVVSAVLDEASSDVYAVNPSRGTIEELVSVTAGLGSPPTVRLLAPEQSLKRVMADFLVASRAADLVDRGTLSLRLLGEPPENSLLITGEAVVAVVPAGERVAGLRTDDAEFVAAARGEYAERWDDAATFDLRTPPLERIRETLADEIGERPARDFDDALASLSAVRGNGNGIDEVTITLLVAARNGELLYDISKWGEDIGLASKATFSRTKSKLEDEGLIDTEKVPIDVGRPRLRLLLGEDGLEGADADRLADVARRRLAE